MITPKLHKDYTREFYDRAYVVEPIAKRLWRVRPYYSGTSIARGLDKQQAWRLARQTASSSGLPGWTVMMVAWNGDVIDWWNSSGRTGFVVQNRRAYA